MENWVQIVIEKWRSEGVKLNSPATIANIEKTESAIGFKFPDDFKELYLKMDGFEGLDWQEHMCTFWPLKMIIEEFDELEYNFVGFSDYFLKINAIGFKKDEPGIFKYYPSIENNQPELITQSFREVVHMINSIHDLIY